MKAEKINGRKENPEEITQLLFLARQGDGNAREQLILLNSNAPLYMSWRKRPAWLDQEEALAIANLHLIRAIDQYIQKDMDYPLSTVIFNTIKWGFAYEKTEKDMYGQHTEYTEVFEEFESESPSINLLAKGLFHNDGTEEHLMRLEIIQQVHRVLQSLPEERRSLLQRYYGIGCARQTLKEIAQQDGISKNKAQLLHEKYMRAFRREWLKLKETSQTI